MIRPTDNLIGSTRGNPDQAIAYAKANGAKRIADVESYIREAYRLGPLTGIDAAIAVAQSSHETGVWTSSWWVERLNGAGIGITGDPAQNAVSVYWMTGAAFAQSQFAHLLLYATGRIDRGGLKPSDDPRYNAYVAAYGAKPVATTISALAGKWAADTDYAAGIVRHATAIYGPNVPDQSTTGGPTGMSVTIGKRPMRIAVGAGHHDTARGNEYETDLNGRKANALIKELRARGHDVYSTHPNDGLGYANVDYNGVAQQFVQYVNRTGWKPDYYIECHSEGSAVTKCGSFILYPDYGGDVDVDLRDAGGVFAQKLQERTGIAPCTILTTSLGVSSEKQSGVGLQGYGLGVFRNTESLNAYCTRLIWEAGAHTCPHDKAIMDRSNFPQLHALATADALEAFAVTRLGWTGMKTDTPTPTTTPAPVPTDPAFTVPSLPIWFETVAKATFPQNQVFENRVKFIAGKKKLRVAKATVQRATASAKGARSGKDLAANTPIDILGTFVSGGKKYALAAGSDTHGIAKGARILLADLDEVTNPSEKAV